MLNVQKQLMKGLLFMKDKVGIFATDVSDTKTGTWRLAKPIVNENCKVCGICSKYCPGLLIEMEDIAAIDYEYCKGCGICEVVCPFKAILMVEEAE